MPDTVGVITIKSPTRSYTDLCSYTLERTVNDIMVPGGTYVLAIKDNDASITALAQLLGVTNANEVGFIVRHEKGPAGGAAIKEHAGFKVLNAEGSTGTAAFSFPAFSGGSFIMVDASADDGAGNRPCLLAARLTGAARTPSASLEYPKSFPPGVIGAVPLFTAAGVSWLNVYECDDSSAT